MKGSIAFVGSCLLLLSSLGFAAEATTTTTTGTSLGANWTCETNASSSSVATDVAADKEMDDVKKSAAEAFSFAAKNCRDCTKITCEYDD